jgi:hypothetical protein
MGAINERNKASTRELNCRKIGKAKNRKPDYSAEK